MRFKFSLFIIMIIATVSYASILLESWQIQDNAYTIKFTTRGVKGTIAGLKGKILFTKDSLELSSFDVEVEVATLNTGNNLKNKHALAKDFFDVATYPTIRFVSGKIEKTTTGFLTNGNLTIKDVTKDIIIPFTFDSTAAGETFKGNFGIDRKNFNLEKKGIGEIVQVELVVPVRRSIN